MVVSPGIRYHRRYCNFGFVWQFWLGGLSFGGIELFCREKQLCSSDSNVPVPFRVLRVVGGSRREMQNSSLFRDLS